MFTYCLNNPVNKTDLLGYISYDAYNEDPNNDNNPLNDVAKIGNGRLQSNVSKSTLLPSNYYVGKHAPKFSTPYSSYTNYSYNRYTQSYEMSTAYYDYAGRQIIRIDWTNHGRSNHGNPHIHYTTYDGQYRDGITVRWD